VLADGFEAMLETLCQAAVCVTFDEFKRLPGSGEAMLAALRGPGTWAPQLLFGQPQGVKLGLDQSQSRVIAGVVRV